MEKSKMPIEPTEKQEKMNISVNGKRVTLFFSTEPNYEAAEFIKSTLIKAYLLKAV